MRRIFTTTRILTAKPSSRRLARLLSPFAAAFVASTASAQTNLALGGTATQSSDYSATNGLAPAAIDGNTDGVWSNWSVTHTLDLANSWWQVDLGAVYALETVRIFNRADCCGTRLSNFWVTVQDSSVEVFREDFFLGSGNVAQGGMLEVQLPPGTLGDVVAVGFNGLNNDGNGFLSLAEVEVYEVSSGAIGTNYCGPANLNSSLQSGEISAFGSVSVANNSLALTASKLPPDKFGVFLNSTTQAFTQFYGGSLGDLCLGGAIGVHSSQVGSSGSTGEFTVSIDLTSVPTPSGLVAVVAGETWNWTCWYRDNNPSSTSNFTDGISILFQ